MQSETTGLKNMKKKNILTMKNETTLQTVYSKGCFFFLLISTIFFIHSFSIEITTSGQTVGITNLGTGQISRDLDKSDARLNQFLNSKNSAIKDCIYNVYNLFL